MMGIGLAGVTMNPAMAARVQRTGNARPLVNTVHSSFITLGIILGSSIGAIAIETWGLRGPLWLGATMALLGLATVLPELARRATPATASTPADIEIATGTGTDPASASASVNQTEQGGGQHAACPPLRSAPPP